MARPVTLFTGQWADLPLETLAQKAKSWGYDGLELACWGDHFEVDKALKDDNYCKAEEMLKKNGLQVFAISNHLVGQCICDNIDARHKAAVGREIWGDGYPEGVRQRAAQQMIDAGKGARRLGVGVVSGFTGRSMRRSLSSSPPVLPDTIRASNDDFPKRCSPTLAVFMKEGVAPESYCYGLHERSLFLGETISARSGHAGVRHQSGPVKTYVRGVPRAVLRPSQRVVGRPKKTVQESGAGPLVFVSYSHKDKVWKDRLVKQLAVLKGVLQTWDDTQIPGGEDWRGAIEKGIETCRVAILMISADYLASPFIRNVEIVSLLRRREKEGLVVLPIIVRPCAWDCIPWLSQMMVRPVDGRAISTGSRGQIDRDLAAIAREVFTLIDDDKSSKIKEAVRFHVRASAGPVDCGQVAEAFAHLFAVLDRYYRSGGGPGFDMDFELHCPTKETYGGN